MESIKTYEDSHDEMVRIRKSIGGDSFSINTSKLDERTKDMLLQSINNVLSERLKETEKVILGAR